MKMGKLCPHFMPPSYKITDEKTDSIWDHATNVQGLVRHRKSGRYYARFKVHGRRTMKTLKTKVWSTAKLRLADELAKAEKQRAKPGRVVEVTDVRMGHLLDRLDACYESVNLVEKTRTSHRTTMTVLNDQWHACHGVELRDAKPASITQDVVADFANHLSSKAYQRVRNNGAKSKRRGYGAVTVNKVLGALHRSLRIGYEEQLIQEIPFQITPETGPALKRPVRQRHLQLPSSLEMRKLFASMRDAGDRLPPQDEGHHELREYVLRRAAQSADLAEFMAYSGARIGEAVVWRWEDDLGNYIYIRGTKTESSRDRRVPKIPAMRDLLERMQVRWAAEGRETQGRVFDVTECREALASACRRIGVPRLTHHMLRHVFATMCIESGVDIPTVSRWLGHSDGGALAMKTYGHLRMEHSVEAAKKVRF